MDIPNKQDILLFRLMICAIIFFLVHNMKLHCSLIPYVVCQTYVGIL